MFAAGLVVESAKGECNLGQHEIAFKYDEVMRTADKHSIYKNGAKEIAAQHGKALTFMAKFDQREGNSCHIHMSLRGDDGRIVFDEGDGPTPHVPAASSPGIQATMCELTLLYAPNINSYKRFQAGSFAPTSTAWGYDNRTCSLRVVGHGAGLRLENRLPGGDVNPYLALAGMLASGLRGIERELQLEPAVEGNAYASDHPQGADLAAGAPATCSPAPPWPARCSATRSSTTTPNMRRRRARRVRRGRHRLGALPRVREDVSVTVAAHDDVVNPATEQVVTTVALDLASRRPTRPSTRAARAFRAVAGGRARRPRPAAAPVRRRGRRRTSRSSPSSRCATPGTRSATPAGRRATSATSSTTTRRRRSGCSAGRSRSRAAWTSPSRSRSASSA